MKILFSGESFEKMLPLFRERMDGHVLEACPKKELGRWISSGVEVLVPPGQKIGEAILEQAKDLKLIQQWGVGFEEIDLEYAGRKGIYVCNVPSSGSGNAESVAELAVWMMLSLARRFNRAIENIPRRKLFAPQGKSLYKQKVAIVGLGNIGREIVRKLSSFDMEIVGVNRSWREEFRSLPLERFCPLERIEEAIPSMDFIVLSLALSSETGLLFSSRLFSLLKEGVFLVNIARAGLIDKNALLESLRRKRLGGVGLDVFWEEPPDPEDELFSFPEVIATPHVGAITELAFQGILSAVAQNIQRMASGEMPMHCVNSEFVGVR